MEMMVQRLQWAGVMVQSNQTKILIDPIYDSPNQEFFGKAKEAFKPLDGIFDVDVILITHLHSDHFDPAHIAAHFGREVPVFVPQNCGGSARERGLKNVTEMAAGDMVKVKEAEITAVPAVDGLGDEQLSWIVKTKEGTIFHGGDTLWHGYWWKIARAHGPFDAVFLPVNGAVVSEPGMADSRQAICMNPEQAAAAARILQAKRLIPIHYGSFHNPPYYMEAEGMTGRLEQSALVNGLTLKLLKHHERLIM
jgi:L-ascorbate metabolism protein UlaG (beta-lactamase superfamily)